MRDPWQTKRQREIRLTREGWLFVVILCFVSVGAVLRNVNLLILMAGLMFAPLFINWRLGVMRLKTLSAKRLLPNSVHARQLASFQWICQNDAKFSAWNVDIRDCIEKDNPFDDPPKFSRSGWLLDKLIWWLGIGSRFRFNARASFLQIGIRKSEVSAYRVFFADRGRYRAGPAMIATSFPFGLIESRVRIPKTEHFFVAPAIGQLDPVWEQRVRSSVVGSDAVKRKKGLEEDEFYALRPWRSGDSKKNIHWRTTARLGELVVKQHDQEDNRDFAMLLDLHRDQPEMQGQEQDQDQGQESNNASGDNENCERCERALKFSATLLLQVCNAVQGRVALAICGRKNAICRGGNLRDIINQTMMELAIAQPAVNPGLSDSLFELSRSVSASTPIYVFSTRDVPDNFSAADLVKWESQAALNTSDENGDVSKSSESEPLKGEPFNEVLCARQLNAIWPSIRWISVDSEEFKKIFTEDHERSRRSLEAITDKWISEDVAS